MKYRRRIGLIATAATEGRPTRSRGRGIGYVGGDGIACDPAPLGTPISACGEVAVRVEHEEPQAAVLWGCVANVDEFE
jgi:hypothetical protein